MFLTLYIWIKQILKEYNEPNIHCIVGSILITPTQNIEIGIRMKSKISFSMCTLIT